jgi:hypothetical protein
MMPVEWPLAASAADRQVEPARPRAGSDRLAIVAADFFLDEGSRLTDEERALMAAMLRGLVSEIADELIAALPPMMAAQAEQGRDGLYRRLRRARLLEREGLVALLLRRADEQQLCRGEVSRCVTNAGGVRRLPDAGGGGGDGLDPGARTPP